jgi:HEAT repeat protein
MEAESVDLSRSLYTPEAVRAAAEAALAEIQVEEQGDILRLTLRQPRRPDLLDHLLNHCLFETVRRSRLGVAS